MKNFKFILSVMLIVCMLFSFGAVAMAEEANVATVVFEANEPDEDGYFTATLTVYNAEYLGLQGALYYNAEAVTPVSFETKEPTDEYKEAVRIATKATSLETEDEINWLSEIWTAIHKEDGYITFANYTALGQEKPNSILNENGLIVAGEDGLKVYEFSFKKISDKDALFEIYQSDRKEAGMIIATGTNENPDVKVTVKQPDSVSKTKTEDSVYKYVAPVVKSDESEDSPLSMDQRVQVRANDVIFLNIDNYAAVSDGKLMWVDKEDKTVIPYIKDSRTMVPLRFIAEQLGADVAFDDATRLITITYNEKVMTMTLGDNSYTLDGEKFEMDTACEVVSSRTFVPVRVIAEAFDKSVSWLENDRMVVITLKTYPWDNENKVEKELLQEIKLMISPMVRDFAYASFSK